MSGPERSDRPERLQRGIYNYRKFRIATNGTKYGDGYGKRTGPNDTADRRLPHMPPRPPARGPARHATPRTYCSI